MATIRKRRDKWQVQIRRRGMSPVSRSFLIRKDAYTWARQVEVEADKGGLPSDPRALEKVTLGELVTRYRDTVTPHKRTASYEHIMLDAFLRRSICSRRVSELRTADFATYRDERLKEIKPSSIARELSPIRHLFEVARTDWGLPVRENPLARLSIKGADQRRVRRLCDGELDRLVAAARFSRSKLLVPIILFALVTGMRRGEILGMKWSDIDSQTKALLIPFTKTGHARTIPLIEEALQVLNGLSQSGDRVFPLGPNALRLAWDRLRRRAGIEDLHFHDLRHEAISRFFEAGLSTAEVALISGHRDARMLFRYTHPLRERIIAQLTGTQLIRLSPQQV